MTVQHYLRWKICQAVMWTMVVLVLGSWSETFGHFTLARPSGEQIAAAQPTTEAEREILRCIAFGPYVGNFDPDNGPHPPPALIDTMLDLIINQTDFRCIMTYGVLDPLDYVFEAASARDIKVIAIIWLDKGNPKNNASIERGIQVAKMYPDTIIRLSCGSELRTRNRDDVVSVVAIVKDCLARLRAAGVTQPLTSIDTWWEWCNEAPSQENRSCQKWNLADDLDWIGINVYPWWENRFSGIYPCTRAAEAAQFYIDRLWDVTKEYDNKEVILTEFGWPAGPDGHSVENRYTRERCGIASEANQHLVIMETLAKLDELGLSGIVFEAFSEGKWKARKEMSLVGMFWGILSQPISGFVQLQGRANHMGTKIFVSEAPCSMTIQGELVPAIDNKDYQEKGFFEIITIPGHDYQCVQVRQPGYLVGQKSSPQGYLGTLTLPGGDVTQDNLINIFDLAFIAVHYGGNDSTADINADGVVNIVDLAIAAENYQHRGPVIDWQ